MTPITTSPPPLKYTPLAAIPHLNNVESCVPMHRPIVLFEINGIHMWPVLLSVFFEFPADPFHSGGP